jgi:hypothetical protein
MSGARRLTPMPRAPRPKPVTVVGELWLGARWTRGRSARPIDVFWRSEVLKVYLYSGVYSHCAGKYRIHHRHRFLLRDLSPAPAAQVFFLASRRAGDVLESVSARAAGAAPPLSGLTQTEAAEALEGPPARRLGTAGLLLLVSWRRPAPVRCGRIISAGRGPGR